MQFLRVFNHHFSIIFTINFGTTELYHFYLQTYVDNYHLIARSLTMQKNIINKSESIHVP